MGGRNKKVMEDKKRLEKEKSNQACLFKKREETKQSEGWRVGKKREKEEQFCDWVLALQQTSRAKTLVWI